MSSEGAHMQPSSELGDGTTPEALLYVLPYVGTRALLALEAVNRQLREAIRGDATLWQHLHVDGSVSNELTGDELLRLASRAEGRMRTLSVPDCTRLPERVVQEIVAANPLLQKLDLSRCTCVSAEAVLSLVRMQADRHAPGLTQLRIRGLCGVSPEMLDALQTTMGVTNAPHSLQFYRNREPWPDVSDERPLDVEPCPICRRPAMVYDCTRLTCKQRRGRPVYGCRACYLCIARCEECGTCVDEYQVDEYEETFCGEVLCETCWLTLPKCSECNRAGCRRHLEVMGIGETTIFSCDACQGLHEVDSEPMSD